MAEEWTLQSLGKYLQSIPTKHDLEQCVTRLESSYKQEIQTIKADILEVGDRVNDMEHQQTEVLTCVQSHHSAIQYLLSKEEEQASHLEDIENRNRRNNIRIRGIPESVLPKDIEPTLQRLFNVILSSPEGSTIELDRAHRALGPRPQEGDKPRDIICRVHHYKQKETIMRLARSSCPLQFESSSVSLMPDLARRTLFLRRALKPLLEVLRANDVI